MSRVSSDHQRLGPSPTRGHRDQAKPHKQRHLLATLNAVAHWRIRHQTIPLPCQSPIVQLGQCILYHRSNAYLGNLQRTYLSKHYLVPHGHLLMQYSQMQSIQCCVLDDRFHDQSLPTTLDQIHDNLSFAMTSYISPITITAPKLIRQQFSYPVTT